MSMKRQLSDIANIRHSDKEILYESYVSIFRCLYMVYFYGLLNFTFYKAF